MTVAKDLVTIKGVLGFDGEYELDWKILNGNELHLIKQLSGVRANEIDEATNAGDWALHIALAVIALQRSGHRHADEAFAVLMGHPMSAVQARAIPDTDEEPVRDLARPLAGSGSSGEAGEN